MSVLVNKLKQLFNENLRGGILTTGNSCVVIGDLNNKVKEFIKSDGTYTVNWKEISSNAYLEIPPNSVIKLAILEWHSTISNYITKKDMIEAYNPITFTTPKKTTSISIESDLINEAIYEDGNFNKQSVKWKDVTNLIEEAGEGYYTVEGIPTSTIVDDLNNIFNHDQAPGWSLTVIYENSNLPRRNINFYIGIQNHDYTVKKINRITVMSNFKIPNIPQKTYLSIVASNGDPNMYSKLNIYNDISSIYSNNYSYLVGNYEDASSKYSNGSIVPYDNVFSGIIMNTNTESKNYGNIETRGSLGNLNNDAFDILNQKSFKGNRGKLDILSFDISNKLKPSQSELILTVDTETSPSASPQIISYALQIDLD